MVEPTPSEVVSYMDEVTSRALGKRPPGPARHQQPIEPFLETADRHKEAGTRLPGPSRMAALKQAVIRVARLYTVEQAAFNQAVLSALLELNVGLNEVRADVDRRLGTSQAALTSTDLTLEQTRAAVDRLEQRLLDVRNLLASSGEQRAEDRTDLLNLRARVDMLLEEARKRLPEPLSADQLGRFAHELDGKLDPLYKQLEDRFRGSREAIVDLQKEYLADVAELKGGAAPVVDIGCGRGEWLELLKDNGIPAYGVDTNATFAALNQERGLDVRFGDALEHLESVPDGSIGAVTGFHLAEHLEFPVLVRLIDAARRALRPGGPLIFETPNPTNVVVGSSAFYLDPTHRNPLHPHFMEFLLAARGFANVELRFLHPSDEQAFVLPVAKEDTAEHDAMSRIVDHLNWAFFGPQDFAVVGRRSSAAD
jgi:O-antigen chain-terminating methyltransferase